MMSSDLERLETNAKRLTFWLGFFTAIFFVLFAFIL